MRYDVLAVLDIFVGLIDGLDYFSLFGVGMGS